MVIERKSGNVSYFKTCQFYSGEKIREIPSESSREAAASAIRVKTQRTFVLLHQLGKGEISQDF
jgi:hypothetical protein